RSAGGAPTIGALWQDSLRPGAGPGAPGARRRRASSHSARSAQRRRPRARTGAFLVSGTESTERADDMAAQRTGIGLPFHPDPQTFDRLAASWSLVPVWTELLADVSTPVGVFP